MALQRNKRRQAVLTLKGQHFHQAPGVQRGGTEIADLARPHQAVEGIGGFFDRRFGVEAVQHKQIEVIRPQPLQRGVDAVQQVLARQPPAVRLRVHRKVGLGGDHHVFTAGERLQRAAENALAFSAGVNVGGIEKIDARFQRLADKGARFIFFQHPGPPGRIAVGHATQAEAGHLQAAVAKPNVVHGIVSSTHAGDSVTAVHQQALAGDEAGLVRRQPQRHIADVF